MAGPVTTVETLCNRLNRSRLISPRDIQGMYKHWRVFEASGNPRDLDRFLVWLVNNHYLTDYQAQQLRVGHSDHFFLNHYKLLDMIGAGRMAGIFKAMHPLGQIVAIKMMPPTKSRETKLLARFQREARMAIRLRHPNIVRTFHLGQTGERHYIVMEHLEGETLEEVLKRRGKIPFAEAVRLIHQALLALQHIHEQGMVHRDMKPGNLMLVPPRPPGAPDNTLFATVKVLDIGLGRVLFDENIAGDGEDFELTTEGMMLGTVEYMAPEQARNPHDVDMRADIYALGCVLFHLLTGRTPFIDPAPVLQVVKHATEQPPAIRSLEPSVPAELQNVIQTMMAKDPKARFLTPGQAAFALRPFLPPPQPEALEPSALARSYAQWVEAQPLQEVAAVAVASGRCLYHHAGKTFGPVEPAQIKQLATLGQLSPDDLLWMEGDDPRQAIAARVAFDFSTVAPPNGAAAGPGVRPTAVPAQTVFDPKLTLKPSAPQTAAELFQKACSELNLWVDLDRNRRLIVSGNMEGIRQSPEIQRFMLRYKRYGEAVLHRLSRHLEFMVENRRRYYCAFA